MILAPTYVEIDADIPAKIHLPVFNEIMLDFDLGPHSDDYKCISFCGPSVSSITTSHKQSRRGMGTFLEVSKWWFPVFSSFPSSFRSSFDIVTVVQSLSRV